MALDAQKNFAYSLVATAPSPANSGTSLVVTAGQGALFPAVPFNATVWPANSLPLASNAEIVRVTNISTDTLTITRTQEGSAARSILVGDQIAQCVTAKTISDLQVAVQTHIVCSGDESDADDTVHNDADLHFAVSANAIYVVEMNLFFTTGTSATVDAKFNWTLPALATHSQATLGIQLAGTLNSDLSILTDYQDSTPTTTRSRGILGTGSQPATWIWIRALIRTGANAGTAQFQWAQNTSTGGTPAVRKADSWLTYTKVA